jgi:light-regulated signal transduction histidine kinase (bacteriophytochrome)
MEVGNGWAEGIHAEDFQRCMDHYLSCFVRRAPVRMEYRLRRADGEYRWILDQGVPRHSPGGVFEGYIGSCIDINDFKEAQDSLHRINDELEHRVRARTSELSRSNADLEQFAYVASHDLQEPLRMISSYVKLLARRYQGKLDADADAFIGFAVDGADRMTRLIRDILLYARAGSESRALEPIDTNAALQTALTNLTVSIAESNAEVTCDPMPTVPAELTGLTEVFQNLIGNALKFRGEAPAKIHIAAVRWDGAWIFTVNDNGIGFDPATSRNLFQLFQRFHSSEEYPGTGIGLAMCKKIVERHGGRIWAESQPGKGSRFHFAIPAVATRC